MEGETNYLEGIDNLFIDDTNLFEIRDIPIIGEKYIKLKCIHEENSQLKKSFTQVVWDGALEISKIIINKIIDFENKDIIELGSGTGIAGLAAYLFATPKSVTLTDCDPFSLSLLDENIILNKSDANSSTLACRYLLWGENFEFASQSFDIILGADVIYAKEAIDPLINSISHLLKKETGTCILSNSLARFSGLKSKFEESIAKYKIEIDQEFVSQGNQIYYLKAF